MALHSEAPDAKSIAFVSMGTGVYKWPMALAADIAVKALLTSTFDQTLMCVMTEIFTGSRITVDSSYFLYTTYLG
ncbi:hypothetical protein ACWCIB_09295 [SAR92 clade bacterium H246]